MYADFATDAPLTATLVGREERQAGAQSGKNRKPAQPTIYSYKAISTTVRNTMTIYLHGRRARRSIAGQRRRKKGKIQNARRISSGDPSARRGRGPTTSSTDEKTSTEDIIIPHERLVLSLSFILIWTKSPQQRDLIRYRGTISYCHHTAPFYISLRRGVTSFENTAVQ